MRQGQQNRRGRGRGGRKPQNPLARNFESNGPDVKIRGTAAHVAEKYTSLARDALASGDLVMAESYFQHAEHYNRIIMAAQQQIGPQHGGQQGEGQNGYRPQRWNDDGDEDDMGEGGGDIRGEAQGGGQERGGQERGVSQDRERHIQDREHHGGGRDRGRHGGNGRETSREGNGAGENDAAHSDEGASDPVG